MLQVPDVLLRILGCQKSPGCGYFFLTLLRRKEESTSFKLRIFWFHLKSEVQVVGKFPPYWLTWNVQMIQNPWEEKKKGKQLIRVILKEILSIIERSLVEVVITFCVFFLNMNTKPQASPSLSSYFTFLSSKLIQFFFEIMLLYNRGRGDGLQCNWASICDNRMIVFKNLPRAVNYSLWSKTVCLTLGVLRIRVSKIHQLWLDLSINFSQ